MFILWSCAPPHNLKLQSSYAGINGNFFIRWAGSSTTYGEKETETMGLNPENFKTIAWCFVWFPR